MRRRLRILVPFGPFGDEWVYDDVVATASFPTITFEVIGVEIA